MRHRSDLIVGPTQLLGRLSHHLFARAAISLISMAAGLETAWSATRITLDPGVTYQMMTGWEATAWAFQTSPAFPLFRQEVFDALVEDVGVNRLRLEIRSGVENDQDYWTQYQNGEIDYATWRSHRYATVNDNEDPYDIDWTGFYYSEMDSTIEQIVLPIKERLEASGEALYVNLNYVAFTGQIDSGLDYHHDDPEEYAEFVLAAFLHLESRYGWVPDGWEVLLEPDNVSQWNGTLLGQAVVATAGRLAVHGFAPDFIVPSNTHMGNAITYFDALVAVPGAATHLRELSYHRYGGANDANLAALASRAQQYGLGMAMLEWWSDGNGYQILHQDLELGRNSAWQQGVVCGDVGATTAFLIVDDSDPGNPIVSVSEKTKFTRQYYKYVRAGATRIGSTSDSGALAPLAFVNLDGGTVVVVKADGAASLEVEGLPAGLYGIKYTTESAYDVDLPDQDVPSGGTLSTSIPARGVLTVFARPTSTSAPSGEVAPRTVKLSELRVVPNPTTGISRLDMNASAGEEIKVDVLDVAGRIVRQLAQKRIAPGTQAIWWDARDDRGRLVPAGVYHYRARSGEAVACRRVVIVR